MGDTIIHLEMPPMPARYKVSSVPRGQAFGVVTLLPDEDKNFQSRQFLLEELLMLMGGRSANKLSAAPPPTARLATSRSPAK